MFKRFLVLVTAVFVAATTIGCHKPLHGLLLEMKSPEIVGYRTDMVGRAVSDALVMNGASWVKESTEGAVILTGLSIVNPDSAGKPQIWSLSISAITSDGNYPLTTIASVRAYQVVPSGDLDKMVLALGKQVSSEFARQFAKSRQFSNTPPVEK